jgi:Protein of unknown function (DUF1616)
MTKQVGAMPDTGGRKKEAEQKDSENSIRRKVRAYIHERDVSGKNPNLLEGMVSDMTLELGYKKHQVIDAIRSLEQNGEISVQEQQQARPSLYNYSLSPYSNWFWASLIATIVSLALVSVTSGFALYFRYFFGSLLILFLPGYSVVELLYARREESENKGSNSNLALVLALSVGLSLVLVPSIALILNYSPIGITLIPLTLALSAITLVCLVAALERKYEQYKLSRYASERPLTH